MALATHVSMISKSLTFGAKILSSINLMLQLIVPKETVSCFRRCSTMAKIRKKPEVDHHQVWGFLNRIRNHCVLITHLNITLIMVGRAKRKLLEVDWVSVRSNCFDKILHSAFNKRLNLTYTLFLKLLLDQESIHLEMVMTTLEETLSLELPKNYLHLLDALLKN